MVKLTSEQVIALESLWDSGQSETYSLDDDWVPPSGDCVQVCTVVENLRLLRWKGDGSLTLADATGRALDLPQFRLSQGEIRLR